MAQHPLSLYESKVSVSDVDRIDAVITSIEYNAARTVIRLSVALSETDLAFLATLYPAICIRASRLLLPAPHPLLNAIRAIDEYILWSYVLAHHNVDFALDIGGNARRQVGSTIARLRNIRAPLVHCCKPILDQADAVRSVLQQPAQGVTSCAHTVQQCSCIYPDLLVSIHSLYYLKPRDVYDAISRSRQRLLYAVVHNISAGFARLTRDSWYLQCGDEIEFYAEDNSYSYRHPACTWLRDGGCHIDGNTLAWASIAATPVSSIYCFTIGHGELTLTPSTSLPLPSRDSASLVDISGDTFDRIGDYLFGRANHQVVIPYQALVRLKLWMGTRGRTPEVWATAGAEARRYLKDCGLPDVLICCSTAPLVSLAMEQTSNALEVSLNSVRRNQHRYERLNRWLKFDFSYSFREMVRALSLSGSFIFGLWRFYRAGANNHRSTLSIILLGFCVWLLWRANRYPKSLACISASQFRHFYSGRIAGPSETAITQVLGVPSLPALPPADDLTTIRSTPIAANCVITQRGDPPVRDDFGLVAYGVINSQVAMPSIYDRSLESYEAMIRRRLTMPPPCLAETFSSSLVMVYGYWILLHHRQVFGSEARQMPVAEWIDSFPEAMANNLRTSDNARWFGDPPTMYQRSIFVKRELSVKITQDGYDGNRPRPIQAGHPALHLSVVPTVLGFQNHLKDRLHPFRRQPWVIPTSSTPAEFGRRWDEAFPTDSHIGQEDDGTNWDHTMSSFLQIPNLLIMVLVCRGPDALRVLIHMWNQMPTVGYLKEFFKIIALEMIHSGDIHTWVLNTMINIGIQTFLRALWLHRDSCIFCEMPNSAFPFCPDCVNPLRLIMLSFFARGPSLDLPEATVLHLASPKDAMAATESTMFVSGDDNANAASGDIPQPPTTFRRTYAQQLGVDLKCKDHLVDAKYRTSFCSGLAWPAVGGTVFGVKLGRTIARFSWWVDPQQRTIAYLDSILHGDCIGRLMNCHHIPFLRLLFKRVIELTKHTRPRHVRKHYSTFLPNRELPQLTDETWAVLYRRYGLSKSDEEQYGRLLAKIPTLPVIFNFAPFARAIALDALDDGEADLF